VSRQLDRIESLTVEDIDRLLVGHSRDIDDDRVRKLADAMAADQWVGEPTPVTIDSWGLVVIDGVHRLAAAKQCLLRGFTPPRFAVWRLMPPLG
tara:strand:+ start:1686 stop:1967 length:282 start_codon:yes stop_codon:yes gene_type:complete